MVNVIFLFSHFKENYLVIWSSESYFPTEFRFCIKIFFHLLKELFYYLEFLSLQSSVEIEHLDLSIFAR